MLLFFSFSREFIDSFIISYLGQSLKQFTYYGFSINFVVYILFPITRWFF
jgi:hypothetical protein